jgi:hypothetical protein
MGEWWQRRGRVEEGIGQRQPREVYFFFFFSFLLFSYWHMIFAVGGNKGGKRIKKKMGGEGRRK